MQFRNFFVPTNFFTFGLEKKMELFKEIPKPITSWRLKLESFVFYSYQQNPLCKGQYHNF